MNNKLSGVIITQLSFLSLKELQAILAKFNDGYNNDRYETWKHVAKTYIDEQITPLLKASPKVVSSDTRTRDEKLEELKSYYVKDGENIVTTNDIPMFRRGRKKKDKTLKDKVFELLDKGICTYEGILNSGLINIAESTFKTINSNWRKEKGIVLKRGRKRNNVK